MLIKILIGLAAVVVAILVIAALRPAHFRIERSVTIVASPADVFPLVNNLQKAQAWSPWVKYDPAAKFAFEGPAAGVGASGTWSGNNKIGEGRQTIVASRPNELIRLKLDFIRPFESTCDAEFLFKAQGKQTVVTWAMMGENNLLFRVVCLFMNQDKMIGGEFEQGLANLKTLVEKTAVAAN